MQVAPTSHAPRLRHPCERLPPPLAGQGAVSGQASCEQPSVDRSQALGGGCSGRCERRALRTSRRLLDTEILESLSSSPAHRSSSSSSVTAISFGRDLGALANEADLFLVGRTQNGAESYRRRLSFRSVRKQVRISFIEIWTKNLSPPLHHVIVFLRLAYRRRRFGPSSRFASTLSAPPGVPTASVSEPAGVVVAPAISTPPPSAAALGDVLGAVAEPRKLALASASKVSSLERATPSTPLPSPALPASAPN